eukprot:11227365-Lingulodinium_polyedra.AAC.1
MRVASHIYRFYSYFKQYLANTSPIPRPDLTDTSPIPHRYSTSPIPRQYLTTTSTIPHHYLTTTSFLPRPLPYLCFTPNASPPRPDLIP